MDEHDWLAERFEAKQVPVHRHQDHIRWEVDPAKPDLGAGTQGGGGASVQPARVGDPSTQQAPADASMPVRTAAAMLLGMGHLWC